MKDQRVKEALTRGVEQVLPSKEGLAKLMKKRKIRLYHGIDPTGDKLHLGHTVSLRKLQEFADLGHEAILVIGTGTVLTGDPSLRDRARSKISEKQIKLADFISNYYKTSMSRSLKLFLPKQIWQGKCQEPQVVFYELINEDIDLKGVKQKKSS